MFLSFWIFNNFFRFLKPSGFWVFLVHTSIGATNRTRREILGLPYAGFILIFNVLFCCIQYCFHAHFGLRGFMCLCVIGPGLCERYLGLFLAGPVLPLKGPSLKVPGPFRRAWPLSGRPVWGVLAFLRGLGISLRSPCISMIGLGVTLRDLASI